MNKISSSFKNASELPVKLEISFEYTNFGLLVC
jgi:hypothetical protein